jgi:acetyltransferase EpsM
MSLTSNKGDRREEEEHMNKVVILGGSGIGMIAASIIDRTGSAQVVGFLNDVLPLGSEIGKYKKIRVIGRTPDVYSYLEEGCFVFIAYVGLTHERAAYEKIVSLEIPPERFISIIDSTAIIPQGYCQVGEGVLCAPLSQLSPDTTLSDNCILLANSFVGHDSFLDRFAHLATNAVVGANVHVGKAAHIGSNATIREKVRIGDYSLVGAGSVVLEDVPEGAVVVGNPARILRVG